MERDSDTKATTGLVARMQSHPVLVAASVLALVAVVAFVLVWFQPQALLFDRVVDEDFPTIADDVAAATGSDNATPEERAAAGDDARGPEADSRTGDAAADGDTPQDDTTDDATDADASSDGDADDRVVTEPVVLASGSFSSRNRYTVEGDANVYELEDGSRVLRLENFSSTNGPDLFVYLTVADEADGDADLDADVVDLGVLRGNIGDQNYDIPDDVDLERYDTVVIWCRRFTVGFGAADLAPAG